MKKILVVGRTSSNETDRKYLQGFYEHLQDTYPEAQYYLSYLDELSYTIAPGTFEVYDTRNGMTLNDIDIVFIRGMVTDTKAYYLSSYCKWSEKSCVTARPQYFVTDKVAQMVQFLNHGLPFLSTTYCPDNALLIEQAQRTYGYPYIMKAAFGSHGDSNYLVNSRAQAEEIIAKEPSVDFLAQAYCPNDHDYRLLLAGDDYLLFERRGSVDSHLNNTSKGAAARRVTNVLPPALIKQSQSLAASLGLMIAGIDIMPSIDTDELYFLEINVQPQIRTGAFLEDKKALLRKMLERLPAQND